MTLNGSTITTSGRAISGITIFSMEDGILPPSGKITVNASRIMTSGENASGIYLFGRNGVITNRGTITSGQAAAIGGDEFASGNTIINAGTLASGAGTAIILPGANSQVILQSGSVIHGSININGNVTFSPGSNYQVELGPAGSPNQLVASGTVSIGGTTNVQVLDAPNGYRLKTPYTIITASDGVLGTFAGVTAEGASPFLAPALSYDPDNVYLTLNTNFVAGAVTPNQRAVATYLDRVAGDPGMQSLVGRLLGMSVLQAPLTFASMDGELHASLATAMLNQGSQALRRLGGRLAMLEGSAPAANFAWSGLTLASSASANDVPAPSAQTLGPAGLGFTGPGFWIQGVGDFSNIDGDANAAGYRYRSGGVATGVDAQVASDTYIGASFSYVSGSMTLDGRNDSGNVNSPQVGLYASHRSGDLSVKAVA